VSLITRFKRWFSELKVAQKLTLIGVFFLIPDSVMLYLFITGINANIQFARLEKLGNEYQRPLEDLLELLPQHRLLSETTAPAALPKVQAQIEAAFAELERVDQRIGPALQFTDEGLAKRKREHYRVAIVRKEWQELKRSLAALPLETRRERHGHLVADVRTMITHSGDNSNLILDPDLDSYYLMDCTLLALPQNQDRLADTMAYAADVIRRGKLTAKDRQQLAIFATLLKDADLERVMSSMQVALTEDPNFYGTSASFQERVPAALEAYRGATQHFIDLTNQLHESETLSISAEDYLGAGRASRDAAFVLWRIADAELDTLLQIRVEDYAHRRAKSLMVTAFALLAACGFVTFITRSISGPLRHQADELRRANAELQDQVTERERAEKGLRLSEARLAAAQKIAALGSWEWTPATGEMVWSEENFRIHGMEPEQFKPTYSGALELVVFADRKRTHDFLRAALADARPFSFEQRIICRDGEERILQQRGEVELDAAGRPLKIVGTAQDVTERKLAEEELERVHRDLLTASRHAGMAEVATGVLHNVGNVLNSVNVAAMLISEKLNRSRVAHLSNVSGLLRDHAGALGDFLTEHPKGRMLPSFIQGLAERLVAEQAELLGEVQGLTRNIGHIKDIVSVQQGYAKGVSGMLESHSPQKLLHDALQMNATALERHGVEVVREFHEAPSVLVDKHQVLQILINLIRNAKEAMNFPEVQAKRLTMRIRSEGERVRIEIADTGIGIAPENLARIFSFGFTTREDGHGFGLHSSALAAREMGGSLQAASDGPGLGATFSLELPVKKTTRAKPTALSTAA
jgi:PAS domain S-box-containing protein